MRVKRGFAGRRRHKKYTKLAKGFRGRRKNCFKLTKIAVERSLANQFIGRKLRKRDFRKLWIQRINAAARLSGISYSQLIHGLKKANVELDRKSLAEMAARDMGSFEQIAAVAKGAL
jgi:large subunit ribosomal protein L20